MKHNCLSRWGVLLFPAFVPTIALGPVGCSHPTSDEVAASYASSALDPHESVDGQTLFKGLFFGRGPVADLFPEAWDGVEKGAVAGYTASREEILASIESQMERAAARGDSALVQAWTTVREQAVEMGDPSAFLAKAGQDQLTTDARIHHVLHAIDVSSPEFFTSFAADIQSGNHLRIADALERGAKVLVQASANDPTGMDARSPHALVLVFVVAAVVAAVALAVWKYVGQERQRTGPHGGLASDEYVDQIARRLTREQH